MQSIQNQNLKVIIKDLGAEPTSIVSLKNNKEYLWRGDAKFWGGQAPVLFPFVGRLKDDFFISNGEKYVQQQHGFFRKSNDIKLIEKGNKKLVYSIKHSEETLKIYPYRFELKTSYELHKNTLTVHHFVQNLGQNDMYFSLGAHPAFNCDLSDANKSYEDCSIVFEKPETDDSWVLNEDGLFDETKEQILNNTSRMQLNQNSFEKGAMVFKKLDSNKITLANKNQKPLVTVTFEDFNYMGIWSVPNAPFVCIEPWLGISDSVDSTQKIEEKEAIIELAANKTFSAGYSIEIHD